MAFACPKCSIDDSLVIVIGIELAPDSRSDEIVIQVLQCGRCGFRGLAVYEESRRGALDSEAWEHTGYQVEEDVVNTIAGLIDNCPDRNNNDCSCESHRMLGQRDQNGRWNGIEKYEMKGMFPMIRNL